jgi:coenzyme Q-binding protein COQ10
MATVERSILIDASTDTIDAIALDGNRLPEWYVGIEQATPDDLYPEVEGRVSLTLTVRELARGHHISYQMSGMMVGTQEWSYAPEGGKTRLTAQVEYDMPGGVLGKIADKLVVERVNTRNLEESLENLKALVEG